MEFRHDSWSAARDRLLEAGVGWCVAETDEKDPKPEDLSWEPVGYLRLRKTEYSDEELTEWAWRIQPALDSGATIFCYFKHEDEGASPKMAKRLEAMLEVPPRATMPQVAVEEARFRHPRGEEPATAGKTQYFTATSIDGYIADPDNSLDWLFQAHDDAHGEGRWDAFIGAVGAMAMGATTYEWVLEHEKLLDEPAKWHEFYGDIPAWVFTHRELPAIPGADVRFVQGDVAPVHEAMATAAGVKNIWLVGGGDLVGQFADRRAPRRDPAPRRPRDARWRRTASPEADHRSTPQAPKRRGRGRLRLSHLRRRPRPGHVARLDCSCSPAVYRNGAHCSSLRADGSDAGRPRALRLTRPRAEPYRSDTNDSEETTDELAVVEGVGISTDHLVGGERLSSPDRFPDVSPIDEQVIAEVARGDATTVGAAVDVAGQAGRGVGAHATEGSGSCPASDRRRGRGADRGALRGRNPRQRIPPTLTPVLRDASCGSKLPVFRRQALGLGGCGRRDVQREPGAIHMGSVGRDRGGRAVERAPDAWPHGGSHPPSPRGTPSCTSRRSGHP